MNLPALGSGQPRCYLYDSPQGGRAGKLHPCFRYTSGSLGIRTLPRAKRKLTKQKAVPTTFIKKNFLHAPSTSHLFLHEKKIHLGPSRLTVQVLYIPTKFLSFVINMRKLYDCAFTITQYYNITQTLLDRYKGNN